jgi:hypothetical protein
VGLHARWGSGKSFLIWLLKKEFDPEATADPATGVIRQWFEPDASISADDDGSDADYADYLEKEREEKERKEEEKYKDLNYFRYTMKMIPVRCKVLCPMLCIGTWSVFTKFASLDIFKIPTWLEAVNTVVLEEVFGGVGSFVKSARVVALQVAPREVKCIGKRCCGGQGVSGLWGGPSRLAWRPILVWTAIGGFLGAELGNGFRLFRKSEEDGGLPHPSLQGSSHTRLWCGLIGALIFCVAGVTLARAKKRCFRSARNNCVNKRCFRSTRNFFAVAPLSDNAPTTVQVDNASTTVEADDVEVVKDVKQEYIFVDFNA